MSESVVVRVTQGDLRGRKIITKSGLQYYSFQGIPYATPPVGNLRFKVSIFILCKKKNSSCWTFRLHSYMSTAYIVVAMFINCFNITKTIAFYPQCIFMFRMTYTTDTFFLLSFLNESPTGMNNGEAALLLCGTNWNFKCYRYFNFSLQRITRLQAYFIHTSCSVPCRRGVCKLTALAR